MARGNYDESATMQTGTCTTSHPQLYNTYDATLATPYKFHWKPQNTLWGFIQRMLQPAPIPTNNIPSLDLNNTLASQPIPNIQELTPRAHHKTCSPTSISYQTLLIQDKTNDAWGNVGQYHQPHDYFRVLSKNVSTLNPQALDMTAIAKDLQDMNTSVFWAKETNAAWKLQFVLAIQTQCHHVQ